MSSRRKPRIGRFVIVALVAVVLLVSGLAGSTTTRDKRSSQTQGAPAAPIGAPAPAASAAPIVPAVVDAATAAELAAHRKWRRTQRVLKLRRSALRLVRGFYSDVGMGLEFAASERLSSDARRQVRWLQGSDADESVRMSTRAQGIRVVASSLQTATVQLRLRTTDVDACADTVRRVVDVTWHLDRVHGRWRAESVGAHTRSGQEPVRRIADCDFMQLPDLENDYPSSSSSPVEHPCIDSCDGPGPRGNGSYTFCAVVKSQDVV